VNVPDFTRDSIIYRPVTVTLFADHFANFPMSSHKNQAIPRR